MASEKDNQEIDHNVDGEAINLHVDGQVFNANKNVLCEHSDYFSAMFSGHYVEQDKKDITIEVVDASSMDIILRYMKIGLIDLSEFSLETIGTLAMAANFLQITELIKQIEYWLELKLSISNWVQILLIAEKASYIKLEPIAETFGLLAFKDMQPEYIPNIQKLFWYLSHPYLDTRSELQVFKFGYKWIIIPRINSAASACYSADTLLIILCCLDVRKLTLDDLREIAWLIAEHENSLAVKVVEFLFMLLHHKREISLPILVTHAKRLREVFTDRVYTEAFNMVRNSNKRKLEYTVVVPTWAVKDGKLDFAPHDLYTFNVEKGFQRWMEVADRNLWGWNLAVWGVNKLVQVCGEHGRGTGRFMRDVRVYDTFVGEWVQHGVQLPSTRHAGVAVNGDSLFIVGGVGAFRVVEDSAIIYDLKQRTFRKATKFPESIQNPAICSHEGSIYASGHNHIYRFVDMGDQDAWIDVMKTDIRTYRMISFKDYIYCTQNYFSNFFRFRPGIDDKMEMVGHFSAPAVGFCVLENRLLAFTRSVCGPGEDLKVEQFNGPCECSRRCNPHIVWSDRSPNITVNYVAGACSVIMSMPRVDNTPTIYHQIYLTRYIDSLEAEDSALNITTTSALEIPP